MKILYLLPAISHPTMRGELRHYHFARVLARRHDISFFALTRMPVTSEALSELRAISTRLVISDAIPTPSEAVRDRDSSGLLAWRPRLAKRRRLRHALAHLRRDVRHTMQSESFDVALVYGVDLQWIVTELGGLPLVADVCDAQSMRIRQSVRFVNPVEGLWRLAAWWRTRRAERWLADHAQQVTFISERDRAAAPVAASRARIIPNGLDADYWSRTTPPSSSHTLVFTGVMDYGPNADAATHLTLEILPRIRMGVSDARLTIAGRNPSAQLEQLATADGAVEVTGYASDLRPHLERASVFVAPLRFASGTQNKILEAMAMGLPVVTSSAAAEGLRVPGADAPPVLVADQPDMFARMVTELLMDPARRGQLGTQGRAYVTQHFNWERSARQLEACCLAAVAAGPKSVEGRTDARRIPAHD